MRRFDPDPRLQIPQQLMLKTLLVWLPFGCQLTDKPLRNNLVRAFEDGRSRAKTLTERGSCHVRRGIEDMSVELEKNIGAGVTQPIDRTGRRAGCGESGHLASILAGEMSPFSRLRSSLA